MTAVATGGTNGQTGGLGGFRLAHSRSAKDRPSASVGGFSFLTPLHSGVAPAPGLFGGQQVGTQ